MLVILSTRLIAGSVIAPGSISGYVIDYYGLAIQGAVVGIENGPVTTTGANGHYMLSGVSSGEQSVGCGKAGYNTIWAALLVISDDTVAQNFTLTQPEMLVNPLLINEILNPGEYSSTPVSILNTGSGPLHWEASVNYLSMPSPPCQYSIALCDTWGDGWNGCSVDVLVNGNVVLNNITLTSGSGPQYFYFTVSTGDVITTDFNPGPFISEPYYYVYDSREEQVWFSPAGNAGPPDIPPGQLIASCQGGQWITMNAYEGDVEPFGGVGNIPVHLDASGMNSGDEYEAEILFASTPDIGSITIPVTLNVQGSEILVPENLLLELIDPVNGRVHLSWTLSGDAFQFFLIRRNGAIIATTTNLSYTDILPSFGNYCYTVQAVYTEGLSSPAGPECIEWPNPDLVVHPEDLEGWVWSGFTVDVFSTIYNEGEGTLSYSFPEYTALNLLKDPDHPGELGAGGPDPFGYVWIDSDENGGPEFSYIDVSTTGNPIFGISDDNIVGPYPIGFDFYFYGEAKTQFWVNSNGCIGFGPDKITNQNTTIPTHHSVYNDFIAWMWDDLVFRTGTSQAFYQLLQDKLVIQFKNYERFGQPDLFINAEIVLYENGKILILYDGFAQGLTLNSCTIGLQSSDPETGLQVNYNAAYLHDDLAIFMRVPANFITNVEPTYGIVPENDSAVISITYDSKDYVPGPYTQELLLESNDLDQPEFSFDNTMHVYLPAVVSGVVYDNDDEDPLNGVVITAGPYQATTGEDGHYILYVDEGKYDLIFEKLGYITDTVFNVVAYSDAITTVNLGMWDSNYPPSFVYAEALDADTRLFVSWGIPQGPYEIIMDDGEADDFFVYASAGSWNAVKFTPTGYPATVIGGSFYVGDGSFPGPFLGTGFGVAVFDDNGQNGLPGTLIDSSNVTVNNSGWVNLDWLNADISEGSFYLAMYQSGSVPHAAPIGVDSDNPTHFKSYSKYQSGSWSLSPLQDFMIRAWIIGPDANELQTFNNNKLMAVPRIPDNWKDFALTRSGKIPGLKPGYEDNQFNIAGVEGAGTRDLISYRISKYTNFNPDDPLAEGNYTELASTQNLYYEDNTWEAWSAGWYMFAVKAQYSNGKYSDNTFSNIIGHHMDRRVTFHVSLTSGQAPENVEIKLKGQDYPHQTYVGETNATGNLVFDMVWLGTYDISINKIGYDIYKINNAEVDDDEEYDIILIEKKYAPGCLFVDPVSLIATWCEPKRTALKEGFEGEEFPPAGWQIRSADSTRGWSRGKNAGSSGFQIPPWDSYYAVVNNDLAGSENNGCCDYLITPMLDLRESEGYALYFDSFYNGDFGQLAYIEYSRDEGESWHLVNQLDPDTVWTKLEVDLEQFSGPEGPPEIWLAFHSDSGPSMGSGWAIDNLLVQVPEPAASYLDFSVFLDNAFIGTTSETTWDFAPLPYGMTFTVSVAARYSSGLSAKANYTFESKYLFPPQNLVGSAPDDAAILSWDPPGQVVPFNLYGYNIYKDGVFLDYLPHNGGWEEQDFVEEELDPGIYSYSLTGVYDLAPYGHPGETGESMKIGPAVLTVDYCTELEFIETWDLGSFNVNNWTSDGPNWSISGITGNPPPVAEFSWQPVQTDYEMSLESYPICAVGITEGTILLDFDLAMYSFQATGNEILQAQVWGWDNHEWITVAEYANNVSGYDWSMQRINIGQLALNKVFKIRFTAKGVNSGDVRGWFIDNIHVYRVCPAPENLSIDPDFYEGVKLTWLYPSNGEGGSGDGTRELVGFYIYRSENGGDYELLEENYTSIPYIDPDTNLAMGSMYCYKVTAVYQGDADQCTSGFSNEVCVIWTGNYELPDSDGFKADVYPNPAFDHLNITSSEEIEQLSLYNSIGIPILVYKPGEKQVYLDLAEYPAGAYIIRIETVKGALSRLVTIRR